MTILLKEKERKEIAMSIKIVQCQSCRRFRSNIFGEWLECENILPQAEKDVCDDCQEDVVNEIEALLKKKKYLLEQLAKR